MTRRKGGRRAGEFGPEHSPGPAGPTMVEYYRCAACLARARDATLGCPCAACDQIMRDGRAFVYCAIDTAPMAHEEYRATTWEARRASRCLAFAYYCSTLAVGAGGGAIGFSAGGMFVVDSAWSIGS